MKHSFERHVCDSCGQALDAEGTATPRPAGWLALRFVSRDHMRELLVDVCDGCAARPVELRTLVAALGLSDGEPAPDDADDE